MLVNNPQLRENFKNIGDLSNLNIIFREYKQTKLKTDKFETFDEWVNTYAGGKMEAWMWGQ